MRDEIKYFLEMLPGAAIGLPIAMSMPNSSLGSVIWFICIILSVILIEKIRHDNMNCTPFVRQYDILSNKWGVLLCQKEYQTNDIRRNSKNW